MALATGMMRQSMRMEERFGPFSNPEACDFEAGLEHLQPWQTREDRALQHGHAFHIRYYYSALARQKLEKVTLQTAAGPRAFYRLPTSAHYEVEHHNPHHADVEKCPICGRTGDYEKEVGNLVEKVHDPLGVEFARDGNDPRRKGDRRSLRSADAARRCRLQQPVHRAALHVPGEALPIRTR